MSASLERLERSVRVLRGYAIVSTVLFSVVALAAFRQSRNTKFEEIDVERINVVEKDGNRRMVISNRARSSGPIERGDPYARACGNRPGIIFFNEEGTENGGLTFGVEKQDNGRYEAVGNLSFDQYNQDQTISLHYCESNGRRRSGLTIAEFEAKYHGKGRAWFGKQFDGASTVALMDATGRTRLRLVVDSAGPARIEFLSDSGRVVRSFRDR